MAGKELNAFRMRVPGDGAVPMLGGPQHASQVHMWERLQLAAQLAQAQVENTKSAWVRHHVRTIQIEEYLPAHWLNTRANDHDEKLVRRSLQTGLMIQPGHLPAGSQNLPIAHQCSPYEAELAGVGLPQTHNMLQERGGV